MKRRALLVGVNNYKSISDLRGCVNDVVDMHLTLRTVFGFSSKEIRAVTDARATKENILARLKWLVKGAKPGDFLVFHFSGHGSQIRDRNGDELKDQLDEIICPYDMNWEGMYITDDELNDVFRPVPEGVLLEVFLDCCHSGSGLKDLGLLPPPELAGPTQILNRFSPPPVDIQLRVAGEEDTVKRRRMMTTARATEAQNHILWAGCQANQTSADAFIGDSYRGAFTYYFCHHVRRDPQASRSELMKRLRLSLRQNNYSQIPELEVSATLRNKSVV